MSAQPGPAAAPNGDAGDLVIRVLGCSGSVAAGDRTTAFLIDHDTLIDAGTGVGDLSIDELARIDRIFVTHSHLDHILGIGLLADTVLRRRLAAGRPPIEVHALPATLQALKAHIFNGLIWPDFTQVPTPQAPALRLVPFEQGQRVVAGARCIEVLPASHVVPAVGFAVFGDPHAQGLAWVFTGDTGPNPALWRRLASLRVASLVIETAFRNDEHALAAVSGHLHPAALLRELQQLDAAVEVWITHIKPGERDVVMAEMDGAADGRRVRALQTGQVMRIVSGY